MRPGSRTPVRIAYPTGAPILQDQMLHILVGERLQVPPPRPTSYKRPVLLVALLAQHETQVAFARRPQADAPPEPGLGTLLYPQTATGPMLGRFSERSTNRPEPLSPTTSPSL